MGPSPSKKLLGRLRQRNHSSNQISYFSNVREFSDEVNRFSFVIPIQIAFYAETIRISGIKSETLLNSLHRIIQFAVLLQSLGLIGQLSQLFTRGESIFR